MSDTAPLSSLTRRETQFLRAVVVAEQEQPEGGATGSDAIATGVTAAMVRSGNHATRRRSNSGSMFDLSLMPRDKIFPRTLHQWSVHHSLTTSKWVATLSRPDQTPPSQQQSGGGGSDKLRYVQFCFADEREARKFCKSYAPPKCAVNITTCMLCQVVDSIRHCRNCGCVVCDKCSSRWGHRMVPKTYIHSQASTVRVCKSCDWLSNAFCMSLLQGRHQDAVRIHETGNVNLRTAFADIHREAMFPIHCAVMGGSLELVQFLVDTHGVPISANREPKTGRLLSVQTSASRTLLDLAMTGRPKVDILMYLTRKGLSLTDAKDQSLAIKTLETILKTGVPMQSLLVPPTTSAGGAVPTIVFDEEHVADESVTTMMEDVCALCCERPMNAVLSPCGHQICCAECGGHLKACPVCKVQCQVLRIFRS